jgi:alpha-tubulin suppressor-like RCC1 family protein
VCAVAATGALLCWGNNSFGQLGDGTKVNRLVPVQISGFGGNPVTQIAAGAAHTCALTSVGSVYCWGSNTKGQLGIGSTVEKLRPVRVRALGTGVRNIRAGSEHSCALMGDRSVRCWGSNFEGQVGDGTLVDRLSPTRVPGVGTGVQGLGAGLWSTCALTSTRAMKCWGSNFYGQLGSGDFNLSSVPVDVLGLTSGVQFMSLGWAHACAVRSGALFCWGRSSAGAVGSGLPVGSNTPMATAVPEFTSGVEAVGAGGLHTCAVRLGLVSCWGLNDQGQLGRGNIGSAGTNIPVQVPGVSGITAVAAADRNTCVLGLGLYCFGNNDSGQVGDGTTVIRLLPTGVTGLSD